MPLISEETIRRVLDATDIVELIGSYFPLKRAGTSYKALCPFHNERTPSFHVNPARQTYHCFGCGVGGSSIHFVMQYEHVAFPEAVRRLASRAGIPIVEEIGDAGDKQHALRQRLIALHAAAAAWFHAQLTKSPAGADARAYLQSRGYDSDTAKAWQLGWAPDSYEACLEAMRSEGFADEDLTRGGLASARDEPPQRLYSRFRARVMFPICNDYGEVIAFSGRVLDPDAKTAKYLNSPETPVFTKGRVLFGLHRSKRAIIEAREAIVCEGQLDLIRAFESGVQNVIAPQGTAFTPDQARVLARLAPSAILCFDSDRAGQEATAKSLPSLLSCGLSVRVARLPAGHDPDSLIRAEGPRAFRDAVTAARDFFDDALDGAIASGEAGTPAQKAAVANRLGASLLLVKDPVVREAVAGRIAARLGIAPRTLEAQLRRIKPQHEPGETETPATGAPIELSQAMRVLCSHALADPESKDWLASHGAGRAEDIEQGGALLAAIATWKGDLTKPSEQAVLASALSGDLATALAALEPPHHRTPDPDEPPTLEITRQWWSKLSSEPLRASLAAAVARLRQPGLDRSQVTALQKEILDLRTRLNDLIRPVA